MTHFTRRGLLKLTSSVGALFAGVIAVGTFGLLNARAASGDNGFEAAAGKHGGPGDKEKKGPGLQGITALCEVTGGGEKVYGIAVEYDVAIDPASLALDSYTAGVFPTAAGYFPGMPNGPDKNATTEPAKVRPVAAIYTNDAPAVRNDQKSVSGPYVITEFTHETDLSLPTTDRDLVAITQNKDVKATSGAIYAAAATVWTNVGERGNDVAIRGVDDWEQNHWWRDDSRSAMLEYSIYLPKSFLKEGGEKKAYPLVLAVTHSGTSYDGTCAQTLTEQCIASIWGMPEEQDKHECVVITPRYERTTMNDYWEHTYDVENTHKLVESLLSNTWNFGNPNLDDRRDKVLKIDPGRVYCTGWSMGAMTSLWLMAKHPKTFAAGLIMAGQQRPVDVVDLAKQNVLVITGANDDKATPWNEKCVPVWEKAGAKVTRPKELLDPTLIFPVDDQTKLTSQVEGYLGQGGNITFLTFADTDHMQSAKRFFYIKAARDWLFKQVRA
jgi:predicted peptidase